MLGLLPLILLFIVFVLYVIDCIHIVSEGHLGMYSIGGALISTGIFQNYYDLSEFSWDPFDVAFHHLVSSDLNHFADRLGGEHPGITREYFL